MSITAQQEEEHYTLQLVHFLAEHSVPLVLDMEYAGPAPPPIDAYFVGLEALMRACQVSAKDARYLRDELREHYAGDMRMGTTEQGWRMPVIRWSLVWLVTARGHHPVAVQYYCWQMEVITTFSRHGCYRPEAGHQPAVGDELECLERRERLQEGLIAVMPIFKHFYRRAEPEMGADGYPETRWDDPNDNAKEHNFDDE